MRACQRQLPFFVVGWHQTFLLAFSWRGCGHRDAFSRIEGIAYLNANSVYLKLYFFQLPLETRSNSNARLSYGAKPMTSLTVSFMNLFFLESAPRRREWRGATLFLVTLWPLLRPTTMSCTTAILVLRSENLNFIRWMWIEVSWQDLKQMASDDWTPDYLISGLSLLQLSIRLLLIFIADTSNLLLYLFLFVWPLILSKLIADFYVSIPISQTEFYRLYYNRLLIADNIIT